MDLYKALTDMTAFIALLTGSMSLCIYLVYRYSKYLIGEETRQIKPYGFFAKFLFIICTIFTFGYWSIVLLH